MLSFESGVKANVVPAKAWALFEGLEGDAVEALIGQAEKDLGIHFTVSAEEGRLKIEAEGKTATPLRRGREERPNGLWR